MRISEGDTMAQDQGATARQTALSPTDAADFTARIALNAARTEAALDALLPPPDLPVTAAMRHAALGGGKRLRA
jgi:hypothetical protein